MQKLSDDTLYFTRSFTSRPKRLKSQHINCTSQRRDVNTKGLLLMMMSCVTSLSVVILLTIQGVCGEEWSVTYKSESTCAFVGSYVTMSCSYTYPSDLTITEVYWTKHNYKDPPPLRDDPDYRNRIIEGCEQGTTRCNLHIKSLTTSDIGEYYFKITTSRSSQKWIGTPGIYLDVKDAPHTSVSISPSGDIQEGTDVTLTCTSTPDLPVRSYRWYKNYNPITMESGKTYTIKHFRPEDSGEYYCWSEYECDKQYSSTVHLQVSLNTTVFTTHSGVITKGSSVTLTCSSDANPPVEIYTWFKVGEYTPVGSGQQYSITNIRSEDGGQYYCEAGNHYGAGNSSTVSVIVEDSPKNTRIESDPSGETIEGSTVTLTCMSEADPPVQTYTWIKKSRAVQLKSGKEKTLIFSKIRSEDRGEYLCQAANRVGQQDSPVVTVQVLYSPKNTRIESDASGEMIEGSTVTLTCMSEADPPVHTYTWIKKSGAVEQKSGNEKTVIFSKIRSEDRGEYLCQAVNRIGQQDSPAVSVQVLYTPKNTTVFTRPSGVITKGSSVTLTCSSDANPPVEIYTWFKVGESTPVGSGQQYSITNIRSEDGGQYYCKAGNQYGAGNSSTVSVIVEDQSSLLIPVVAVSVCGLVCLLCGFVGVKKMRRRKKPEDQDHQYSSIQLQSRGGAEDDGQHSTNQPHGSRETVGAQGDDVRHTSVQLKKASVAHGRKRRTPACDSGNTDNITQGDVDYGNDPREENSGDEQMSSVYQSLNPNTTQPDAVYQSLNPNTTQPDAVYQSLNPNTTQPDAVYQSLKPNTTQPDAVYQNLNPNTN